VKEKIRDRPAGFLFRLSLIMNELPLLDLIPKNQGEIEGILRIDLQFTLIDSSIVFPESERSLILS